MTQQREVRHEFTSHFQSETCVEYYQEAMNRLRLVERNEISAKYCEKYLVPTFKQWAEQLGKPLNYVDLLCSHGCDTLAYINGYYQTHFAETWSSDETCYNIVKPRLFPVKTLGVDISENALEFTKKAGIMDETETIDFNNMTDSNKAFLQERLKSANILHANSLINLDDGIFEQILDWFSQGTEPGIIIIGFIYPHDIMDRINTWKQLMISKFNFQATLPAYQRYMYKHESEQYGPETGMWKIAFYDTWYLTRKL